MRYKFGLSDILTYQCTTELKMTERKTVEREYKYGTARLQQE